MPTERNYAESGRTLGRREARSGCFASRPLAALALAQAIFAGGGCSTDEPTIPQPRLVVLYATCTLNKDFIQPYDENVPYTPALRKFSEDSIVFRRHTTEAGVSGIAGERLEPKEAVWMAHPERLPGGKESTTPLVNMAHSGVDGSQAA